MTSYTTEFHRWSIFPFEGGEREREREAGRERRRLVSLKFGVETGWIDVVSIATRALPRLSPSDGITLPLYKTDSVLVEMLSSWLETMLHARFVASCSANGNRGCR